MDKLSVMSFTGNAASDYSRQPNGNNVNVNNETTNGEYIKPKLRCFLKRLTASCRKTIIVVIDQDRRRQHERSSLMTTQYTKSSYGQRLKGIPRKVYSHF